MKHHNRSSLVRKFISLSLVLAFLSGGAVTSSVGAKSKAGAEAGAGQRHPLLARYATDLTRLARLGRLSTSAEFEADVEKAVEALARDAGNPVLLTDAGSAAAEVVR